jgi:hypothetical protein
LLLLLLLFGVYPFFAVDYYSAAEDWSNNEDEEFSTMNHYASLIFG